MFRSVGFHQSGPTFIRSAKHYVGRHMHNFKVEEENAITFPPEILHFPGEGSVYMGNIQLCTASVA